MLIAVCQLQFVALAQETDPPKSDTSRTSTYFSFDSLGVYGETSGLRDTIQSERNAQSGRIFLGGSGGFWGVSTNVALFLSTDLSGEKQDMNVYAVENSYKWIHVSIGDHYPVYGQLSLSGVRTRGVGIALSPGSFRFEANYGQTERAIEGDSAAGRIGAYSRWMYGARVGYDDGNDVKVSANIVKLKDGVTSILNPNGAMPQENLLAGVDIQFHIDDALVYKGEIAGSAHTRDLESAAITPDGIPDWIGGLISPHSSTSVQYSTRHELKLRLTDVTVSALYSRVNSGYSSLGSEQLASDWQEIKLDSRVSLLHRKLQVSGFFSHRNNNLNDDRFLTTRQVSGGGTMSMYTWRGVYINAMYSFMLETNDAVAVADMRKSLTHSFFVQPSFEFYGSNVIHHIDLTASIQTVKDHIAVLFPSLDFSSFNLGGNYFASFTELFTFLANYTLVLNASALDGSVRHLVSGRLLWDLFDNVLSTSLNATYTSAKADLVGIEDNQRFDFELMARYSFSPSEQIQLDLRRTEYVDFIYSGFNEFIGSIKYIRGI